jgi:hypothetical protein
LVLFVSFLFLQKMSLQPKDMLNPTDMLVPNLRKAARLRRGAIWTESIVESKHESVDSVGAVSGRRWQMREALDQWWPEVPVLRGADLALLKVTVKLQRTETWLEITQRYLPSRGEEELQMQVGSNDNFRCRQVTVVTAETIQCWELGEMEDCISIFLLCWVKHQQEGGVLRTCNRDVLKLIVRHLKQLYGNNFSTLFAKKEEEERGKLFLFDFSAYSDSALAVISSYSVPLVADGSRQWTGVPPLIPGEQRNVCTSLVVENEVYDPDHTIVIMWGDNRVTAVPAEKLFTIKPRNFVYKLFAVEICPKALLPPAAPSTAAPPAPPTNTRRRSRTPSPTIGTKVLLFVLFLLLFFFCFLQRSPSPVRPLPALPSTKSRSPSPPRRPLPTCPPSEEDQEEVDFVCMDPMPPRRFRLECEDVLHDVALASRMLQTSETHERENQLASILSSQFHSVPQFGEKGLEDNLREMRIRMDVGVRSTLVIIEQKFECSWRKKASLVRNLGYTIGVNERDVAVEKVYAYGDGLVVKVELQALEDRITNFLMCWKRKLHLWMNKDILKLIVGLIRCGNGAFAYRELIEEFRNGHAVRRGRVLALNFSKLRHEKDAVTVKTHLRLRMQQNAHGQFCGLPPVWPISVGSRGTVKSEILIDVGKDVAGKVFITGARERQELPKGQRSYAYKCNGGKTPNSLKVPYMNSRPLIVEVMRPVPPPRRQQFAVEERVEARHPGDGQDHRGVVWRKKSDKYLIYFEEEDTEEYLDMLMYISASDVRPVTGEAKPRKVKKEHLLPCAPRVKKRDPKYRYFDREVAPNSVLDEEQTNKKTAEDFSFRMFTRFGAPEVDVPLSREEVQLRIRLTSSGEAHVRVSYCFAGRLPQRFGYIGEQQLLQQLHVESAQWEYSVDYFEAQRRAFVLCWYRLRFCPRDVRRIIEAYLSPARGPLSLAPFSAASEEFVVSMLLVIPWHQCEDAVKRVMIPNLWPCFAAPSLQQIAIHNDSNEALYLYGIPRQGPGRVTGESFYWSNRKTVGVGVYSRILMELRPKINL